MIKRIWGLRGTRFIAVGLANTLVDFLILNFLVFAFGLNQLIANSISVSVAMLVSYLLNNRVVFKDSGENHALKFVTFICITAFGMFVIQNVVIYLFTHNIVYPANLAVTILHGLGFTNINQDFISLNLAKLIATCVTLIWNYFMYRKFVFTKTSANSQK